MKRSGLVWLGIQTERFDEMERLFGTLFGAAPGIVEPGFRLWRLANGDLVELFAAGTKPPFESAPVVGFLVDDLDAARRDLPAAGAEIVGGYGPNEDGYASLPCARREHLRGRPRPGSRPRLSEHSLGSSVAPPRAYASSPHPGTLRA